MCTTGLAVPEAGDADEPAAPTPRTIAAALAAETATIAARRRYVFILFSLFRLWSGAGGARRLERGPQLGREQFRLFPGGEMAAPLRLVEVVERGVGAFGPAARGLPDLS